MSCFLLCYFITLFYSFTSLVLCVLLSFSCFFSCFFFIIFFVLSFSSFLLVSHCWEVIVFSVSLIYYKSFSKFSILLLLKRWYYFHWYYYPLFLFVAFFLLPYFTLLYSLHLLYSAHLCLYFCKIQMSTLDKYLAAFASFAVLSQTRASSLHKYLFLRVFILYTFLYSSKKYFNSTSDISDHSWLVTNKLVFFLHNFTRCCFDPHT